MKVVTSNTVKVQMCVVVCGNTVVQTPWVTVAARKDGTLMIAVATLPLPLTV